MENVFNFDEIKFNVNYSIGENWAQLKQSRRDNL